MCNNGQILGWNDWVWWLVGRKMSSIMDRWRDMVDGVQTRTSLLCWFFSFSNSPPILQFSISFILFLSFLLFLLLLFSFYVRVTHRSILPLVHLLLRLWKYFLLIFLIDLIRIRICRVTFQPSTPQPSTAQPLNRSTLNLNVNPRLSAGLAMSVNPLNSWCNAPITCQPPCAHFPQSLTVPAALLIPRRKSPTVSHSNRCYCIAAFHMDGPPTHHFLQPSNTNSLSLPFQAPKIIIRPP